MKLKSLILTFALTLFAVSGLFAQEKYEYGVLELFGRKITFITADKEEILQTGAPGPVKEFLQKLNELNEKGWEVYNTTQGITNYTDRVYHLRKKKN